MLRLSITFGDDLNSVNFSECPFQFMMHFILKILSGREEWSDVLGKPFISYKM